VECVVKIEVSGTPEEMALVLRKLETLMHEISASPPARSEARSPAKSPPHAHGNGWWNPERAQSLVRTLTPAALMALKLIAERAPETPVQEIQSEMHRAGLPMTPGRMSSIGFAIRRLGAPAPFVRDAYQGMYHIDKRVAELFLGAIDAEELRRQQTGVDPPARERS
jgi:hypothetical protein